LIILFGDSIGIVLLKFGLESAEHVPNQGKVLHERIAMA
jgi:hypothetical protein